MEVIKKLTKTVKDLRLKADLAQKEVAEAIDMNITSYNHMEAGRQGMKLEQLIKLRDFYWNEKKIYITLDYIATGRHPDVSPEIKKLRDQLDAAEREIATLKKEIKQTRTDHSNLLASLASKK